MIKVCFITPGMPSADTVEKLEKPFHENLPDGIFDIEWYPKPGRSQVKAQEYLADPLRLDPGDEVIFVFWSAGYGFVREALKDPDFDNDDIIGIVSLDSIYDDHGLSTMKYWEPLATKLGSCFLMAFTDVEPGAYASTKDTALHLEKYGARTIHIPPGKMTPRQQHSYALNEGAQFIEHMLDPLLKRVNFSLHYRPWHDELATLQERCTRWCEEQVRIGVKEVPLGSNKGPQVSRYFDKTMRNGKSMAWLGQVGGPWCAAAQAYSEIQASLNEHERFLPQVVSGIEMERWAKTNGHWSTRREGVQRGDICILRRGNTGSWERHVVRVTKVDSNGFWAAGGNEDNRWKITERPWSNRDIVGFIKYPRKSPTDDEVRRAVKAGFDEVAAKMDKLLKLL